ncbi:type I 3-dehydroquinate dehydratase [Brevibacterium sp. p3-SID960]|uniref:type I 3-dehydroquinate dehydratase n=1 Tax=Brevibacterium sp. p3-SID960 TaxID=2916063 RepID=UPI0021A43AAE|nr:type I 3-dehydroquinate dehydratase [Brevibacterium sp. p3-SID960]MCT1690511.1 type I 3-dehydroquinate dehydratase [Brevibacterium sp. p3-SID960]
MTSLPFVASDQPPAVIVPLVAEDLDALGRLAADCAQTAGIDAREWRVDALAAGLSAAAGGVFSAGLAAVRAHTDLPVLLTIRTDSEGGAADLDEDAYTALIGQAIAAGPAAVDIEFARRDAGELITAAAEAGVASVASAHDFTDTPPSKQLLRTLKGMADLGADVAKIAVMPHDRSDVLEALRAADRGRARLRIPIIVIAMGRRGRLTRLIGGEFGSVATFATVGEGSAPGQVSVPEVRQTLQILAGED